jgi:ABC-type iron transport system FetAB ATPase subunit
MPSSNRLTHRVRQSEGVANIQDQNHFILQIQHQCWDRIGDCQQSSDEEAKEEVEGLILKIVQQNELTCVIVSHDLAQAARIASRIMMSRQAGSKQSCS